VGTGPYRLVQWDPGTQLIYRAFHDYFMGPPQIEEVIVRIIPDTNAVISNLLAGVVDTTVAGTLGQQGGDTIKSKWSASGEGEVLVTPVRWRYPQIQFDPARSQQPSYSRASHSWFPCKSYTQAMHYEVWSTNTGNLIADCDTEAEALTLVRGLLAAGWSADDLAVALEYDESEQIDDSPLPRHCAALHWLSAPILPAYLRRGGLPSLRRHVGMAIACFSRTRDQSDSPSSTAFASCRSGASNPSVNQP